MADNKIKVDASDILVKLHFSGLQKIRKSVKDLGDGFIVNTGIHNDNAQGTPEKVGKTKFQLGNESYYVGAVADFTYEQSFELQSIRTDIFKLIAELDNQDDSLLASADTNKSFNELGKRIYDALQSAEYKDNDFPKTVDDFISACRNKKYLLKLRDDINQMISANHGDKLSNYNEKLRDAKQAAYKVLADYMNVFAGEDNVDMNESSVTAVQVSSDVKDSNDKRLVKDFAIQPISQGEQKKLMATFQKNAVEKKGDRQECKLRMCYYVQYKLSVQ